MEQQVLEQQGVFEETLERFGERDCQSGFALVVRVLFQPAEDGTYFGPFVRVGFLGFGRGLCGFRVGDGRESLLDLVERAFEVEDVVGVST